MSNIDMSMLSTAQARADAARQTREEQLKALCCARIIAVADRFAQANMTAAAAVGKLDSEEMAAYGAFLDWVEAMRAACRPAAGPVGSDCDDADFWPSLPAVAAEFIRRF
ncbi:hypothetical protein K3757_18925 (plasmid) [Sulfitobacter sp. S223]|uniref:hypothetical protein n=1 Tax=Sulfitobacter sp. S223 TaxID=2867023 RepID=UPI0021A7095C|nr:hypothetical protein [Sulfitobacter sp. S223]UWR28333.1 hypothetical protein K3757_18925 [Sulfitobacter sp. S223]